MRGRGGERGGFDKGAASARAGFTLIQIVIAMGFVALVGFSVFQALVGATRYCNWTYTTVLLDRGVSKEIYRSRSQFQQDRSAYDLAHGASDVSGGSIEGAVRIVDAEKVALGSLFFKRVDPKKGGARSLGMRVLQGTRVRGSLKAAAGWLPAGAVMQTGFVCMKQRMQGQERGKVRLVHGFDF